MQVLGLLADLQTNRLDNPDFQRRLEGLLAEFDRLEREHLPPIGTELTAAIKGSLVRLQSSPRPIGRDGESESHLVRAGEHQQQVIASLEGLLAGMRQWDDYRRFHREVAQLLRDQEEVARNTAAMGAQTVGRDLKELSPQESADLKILAEHQLELGRRQTRLEQEMEQTAAALGQSEPLAAANLTDAVAEARRLAIAADMSTAGGHVRDNGLGLAPTEQQRVLQNLQEVLDILANNRRQELGLLAKKLGEADKDLDTLHKQQEGLRPQDRRKGGPVRFQGSEERKAKGRTSEAGPRAGRTSPADPATQPAAGAAVSRRSRQRREQGGRSTWIRAAAPANAGDGQGASRGAKEAEKALEDAARQLREKRFEIEAQLAMEQQASLQDTIKHLHRPGGRNREGNARVRRDGARRPAESHPGLQPLGVGPSARLAPRRDRRVRAIARCGQHLPHRPVGCR